MKLAWSLLLIPFIFISSLSSCPGCVGRVRQESPPFFHQDFYPSSASSSPMSKKEYGIQKLKLLTAASKERK